MQLGVASEQLVFYFVNYGAAKQRLHMERVARDH